MLNSEAHSSRAQDRSSSSAPELRLDMEQLQVPATTAVLPPIQFPHFSGDNFSAWKYKCNQLFQIYKKLPDEVKVRLASIYMEGDALHWHQKFTENMETSQFSWEEYLKEMEIRFGNQAVKAASTNVAESTTPQERKKRFGRRICRLQIMSNDDSGGKAAELEDSHFRFGPVYRTTQELDALLKEGAWETVLKNSPDRPAATKEIYSSAVRKIEEKARKCYQDDFRNSFTGTEFRWLMIKDGCFFLQLTLCLLGGSDELGYSHDHDVFGQNRSFSKFRDVKEWIKAMFFVGNQIPFVVLKVLLKQEYFQRVMKKAKWDKPSDMSRKVLYELLLLPELEAQSWSVWRFCRKLIPSRVKWLQQQVPIDLLHGFQLLILGPEKSLNVEEEEEEDIEDQSLGIMDDITSRSATQLYQSGIHFWNCQRICHDPFWSCCCIGSRRIRFFNSLFCCYGCAILWFPPIVMADDTELMFRGLRNYEISQKFSGRKKEFCSYLRFMSELIKTPEDARIMASNNVIQGNRKQKHKLPGMLRDLALKGADNRDLRRVKVEITDYSPPIWKKYWQVLGLGFVIAVLQTVFSILDFFGKSKKS